jgi:hypothetical protein
MMPLEDVAFVSCRVVAVVSGMGHMYAPTSAI